MTKDVDMDAVRKLYVHELLHPKEIARALGVSQKTIERRLKRHGVERQVVVAALDSEALRRICCDSDIPLSSVAQSLGVDLVELAERISCLGLPLLERHLITSWLAEQIETCQRDPADVAEECGTSKKTIYEYIRRFGISRGDAEEPYHSPAWCRKQHYDLEKSIRAIAREVGKNPATISDWFRKHGIAIRGEKHPGHRSRANAPYRDEAVLRDLLEEREMSEAEAAQLLDCSVRNIQYWRQKHAIQSRSRSEAMTLRHSKVPAPYKERDWCVGEYSAHEKSSYQIADELGVSPSTIRGWLVRHGIELRSGGESYHLTHRNSVEVSDPLKSILEGELLGDGSIIRCSRRSAFYSHGSKYEEYVRWLSEVLSAEGLHQSGGLRRALCNEGTGHESVVYRYHSLCYPELLDWRDRFYPRGKKIVPPDLRLDPIVCRQWYIGDGRLVMSSSQRSTIVLYTCAFDPDSLERLRQQLRELGFETTIQKSRNQLYMPADYVRGFLSYIGECPRPIRDIYGYKWGLTQ